MGDDGPAEFSPEKDRLWRALSERELRVAGMEVISQLGLPWKSRGIGRVDFAFDDVSLDHVGALQLALQSFLMPVAIRSRQHERIGIPADMCPYCGLIGNHVDRMACINALRSALAEAQFKAKGVRRSRWERAPAQADAGTETPS